MLRSMTYQLHTIPCRTDNFAFVLTGPNGTAVVDAPEAAPILTFLDREALTPDVLLLTHHHHDHIEAVPELRERGAQVWGAAADADRLPDLDRALVPGTAELFGEPLEVIDVPGHTIGHLAYYLPNAKVLFSADSLMALGCGRLFEGTPEQMWSSLCKLRALPGDTLVCSGHEYTAANARFAVTVERDNSALGERAAQVDAKRAQGEWTVPELLSVELATNPFLRADMPEVKAAMKMPVASDVEVFAAIRAAKDRF